MRKTALAGTAFLWAGLVAHAQSPSQIVHEDFDVKAILAATRDDENSGQNPAALRQGDNLVPEPAATPAASNDKPEPIFGQDGFYTDRLTELSLDEKTGADSTLHYSEVFNPSVLPFKRMSVFDTVDAAYTLRNAVPSLSDVPLSPSRADLDHFWGSLLLELEPGKDVAIPSVSPDMQVVSYETTPKTRLIFSKDGSDNFFVRTEEPISHEPIRLVFLVQADPRYFAPILPEKMAFSEIPAGLVRPLPPDVQNMAQNALSVLHVNRSQNMRRVLDTLVAYFRNFSPKTITNPTGNIFWDLFSTQAGVCRHRSFAFIVTANALGIPARWVANEAHAFVEVYLPRQGWARIDLGGAADTLQVQNAEDKTMYQPKSPDPFPKPSEYANNYTRLEGDVRGVSDRQKDQARQLRSPSEPPSQVDGTGSDGTNANDGNPSSDSNGKSHVVAPESAEQLPPPRPEQKSTFVQVSVGSREVFLGETISAEGRITTFGEKGVAGLRVDILLAPAASSDRKPLVLGHTTTGPNGEFSGQFAVQSNIPLDEYELLASTPGDDLHAAAISP